MLKRKRKSRSIKDREAAFNAGSMLLGALLLLIVTALALDWVLRPDKFPVENVHFEGPFQRVTKEQLIEAVRDQVNRNFFALDLGAVKQRLESLPWVYRASVRRRWPRALHIRFSEQQLVARWGEHDWVNHAGELVPGTGTD
ncbi:MAG: cell division protein FtsQ/DivIB, partial [Acidiferrobacterales bacterium]